MADLGGRVVAFLESRRSAELADLISRHGGVPYPVPCLRELHDPDTSEMAAAVELLCNDRVQFAVFLTGVGANTILEAARVRGREQELLAALSRKHVAVRGPKPTAVLRKAGVRIDLQAPEPNTSAELLAAMEAWDVKGKSVLVQLYGGPNPAIRQELERRGADVAEVSPYRWDRPLDERPALRLFADLQAGQVDVLAGTNAAHVDNLFVIAREGGQENQVKEALRRIPVAAQGPVCALAFEREGIPVAITPSHGHMGSLVLAIAQHFEQEHPARAARRPAERVIAETAKGD